MASTFFGLNIGASALSTFQIAINTTANNISNVQTEGYTRQTTNIETTAAMRVTAKYGSCGTGVAATEIVQERDQYYDTKYLENNCKLGYYDQCLYYLDQIDGVLEDTDIQKGFTTILSNMFNALDTLKNDPNDESVRNQFINQAQMLCTYFGSVSASLSSIQDDCNQEIKSAVNNINAIGQKISLLNKEINTIEIHGGHANELRDERAKLLDELSSYVSVETKEHEIQNSNGENLGGTNFTVIINGQVLVDGNDYRTLRCQESDYKKNQSDIDGLYNIVWEDTGMRFAAATEGASGSLKALFSIRDGNAAENMKGSISAADTTSITIENLSNTDVNALSIPPEGQFMVNSKYYAYTGWSAEVNEDGTLKNITFQLAEEIPAEEAAAMVQKQSQLVCGETVDVMGVPYYQQQINEFIRAFTQFFNQIEQDGETLDGSKMGSFFVVENKTGSNYTLADWKEGQEGDYPTTITSDSDTYYQMTASNVTINTKAMNDPGYFATGVSMTDGTGAYDLIEKLLELQSNVTFFRGSSASKFLETLLSDITVDTQKTEVFYDNYYNLSTTIDTMRMSISGVDEDEEALGLIKFQNAYNLASKVISVMSEMYDKLINETGVV